jgi:hypothetical protein
MGELDLDELYLTINDDYMNDQLKALIGTDLILFQSLSLDNQIFTFSYELNPNNKEAVAIDTAMTEVNSLLTTKKQTVKDEVSFVLDSNNPIEQQVETDLNQVLDLLSDKVTSDTSTFTDAELSQIDALASSFSQLDETKQNAVANAIINQMDPTNKQTIEDLLNENGSGNLTDLINQFLGS